MSDLASQPLEDTSETPLTLAERRANYESWLQSGRRTAMPAHTTRVDDLRSKTDLRAKAEADAAGKLLNDLPPRAIVRTDDGTGDSKVELTDDLRLNIAQALLPKIEGATADQAERIANLTSTILGPAITRADDVKADENLKNEVLNQGKGGVKGDDDKKADDAAPTLTTIMDTLGKITGRLDALEGKKAADNNDDPRPVDKGNPKSADDSVTDDAFKWRMKQDRLGTIVCSPDTQDAFALVQSRADKVYSANGQQADKPLYGETLSAYRRRLLKPLQKYSDTFRNSDLRVVAVDPAAFNAVEDSIYKSAADAAKDPRTVPLGFLREHVEQRGGHTYTTFTGRPISWMNQFAPTGKRIKRVNQHTPGGPSRVLYGSP
jgi:hypothetical protein